jgi:hypothetical protein
MANSARVHQYKRAGARKLLLNYLRDTRQKTASARAFNGSLKLAQHLESGQSLARAIQKTYPRATQAQRQKLARSLCKGASDWFYDRLSRVKKADRYEASTGAKDVQEASSESEIQSVESRPSATFRNF